MSDPAITPFGYKIVDRDLSDMISIIGLAQEQGRPVEVGIYFDEPGCREKFHQLLPQNLMVNAHFDHRHLSVLKVFDQSDLLQQQIQLARAWGADYGITHVSAFPLSVRDAYQGRLFQHLEHGLAFYQEVIEDSGFPTYIENTFHSLDFYRRLFDLIDAKGYGMNFCFDIGHAKVWSQQTLGKWLDFLDQLAQSGRCLHFHCHGNSGVTDEHLSLPKAEAEGFTIADAFTGERDLFQALAWIQQRFPQARKIFEVPPQEARENMERLNTFLSTQRP